MSLQAGQRLGSYEIAALIGKGGMGEVYRAHDTKLRRDVAIKVLPDTWSEDEGLLGRFQREAQLLASLNHPNIAHVYGFEEFDGRRFIIMEYVQGETLAQRLKRGRIPAEEALRLALQIAEALEAAQEHSIIHRDLKPGNIIVMPDMKVKVLDFGLAKVMEADPERDLSESPTQSLSLTGGGVLMGTAPYMSPEQAKGQTVDRRTDIFAFGCVLYEMLTGRRAFEGENTTEVVSRVLQREPDWTRLPPETGGSIRRLLRVCLEKDRKRRRQTAIDVRIDLEQALTEHDAEGAPVRSARAFRKATLALIAAGIVIGAVLSFFAAPFMRDATTDEIRLQILTPSTPLPFAFALAPDGRQIAFVASGDGPQRLWLRALDKNDARPLAGTEGADYPFWSADSRSIGFFASGKLYRVNIDGSMPQFLANAPAARGGTWNAEGTILFAPTNGPLMRIPATGEGNPVVVTRLQAGETSHRFPEFLPDGNRFLFFAQGGAATAGIYLSALDSGEPTRLVDSRYAGSYLHPDRLLFVRQGALLIQQLDVGNRQLTGDSVVVADPVALNAGLNQTGVSTSMNGRIAYRAATPERELAWYDRKGTSLAIIGQRDSLNLDNFAISPDQRTLATQREVENDLDIWLWDLVRSSFDPFTRSPTVEAFPIWSDDGSRIAFMSTKLGPGDLYVKAARGSDEEQLVWKSPNNKGPQDWHEDFLLYVEVDPERSNDLLALDLSRKNAEPQAVAKTPFDEKMGQFSPDGRWVAYTTDEPGRFEIVVQPFPDATDRRTVSINGGIGPRWSDDGRELYFVAPDGKLMAASVTVSGNSFAAEVPKELFQTRMAAGGNTLFVPDYAVSRDGRFLINQPSRETGASPITLILNLEPGQK